MNLKVFITSTFVIISSPLFAQGFSPGSSSSITATAGSFAPGSLVDGADITQGTKEDTPCTVPTSTTSCTLDSLLKAIANSAGNATSGIGGISSMSSLLAPAASTNATSIKTSAGRVYKIVGCNYSTTQDFTFHFTNSASAPTPGSTAVVWRRTVPRSNTAGSCNPFSYDFQDIGWYFSTGIGFWVSAAVADTDTTAPSAASTFWSEVDYQ